MKSLFFGIIITLYIGLTNNSFCFSESNISEDTTHAKAKSRIVDYLTEKGIDQKYKISYFARTFIVRVIQKKDDEKLLIWSDFFFKQNGDFRNSTTEIHRMKYIDCNILSEDVCAGLENLKKGYQKQYNEPYEGIVKVNETPSEINFEIIRMAFTVEIWTKFNFEGVLVQD